MTTPSFYQPERATELYTPDLQAAVQAGQDAGLSPAEGDSERVCLLIIDAQVDFVHPNGSLYVPGAEADTKRIVEWFYDNAGRITKVIASLDSHIPIQIFYPTWWINRDEEHPAPYTVISHDEVKAGDWRPLYDPDWSQTYVAQLENEAKKQLMIWPYHTMIGTPGHNMMPALYEAVAYHTAARQAQPQFVNKGTIPKTEYYSLLEPEVKAPEDPRGTVNESLMGQLAGFDKIYVTGQAKSHCVLESLLSVANYFEDRQPEVLKRVHLIEDTTSSVAHPEIDFEALATSALDNLADKGLSRISVTEA